MRMLPEILNDIYQKYNRTELIGTDPLIFVYNYSNEADREIAGFFASALAYGRVGLIQAALRQLFSIMQPSPYEFVINFSKKNECALEHFKYRFNTGHDIAGLVWAFKSVLQEFGSLEKFFLSGYSNNHENIIPGLEAFTSGVLARVPRQKSGGSANGVEYLLADPRRKSPCKRLNMFLRWMVRSDQVDPGVWESVSASKLIVPLDTHMIRLCRILGLYDARTVTLKTAVEVTNKFAQICPEDPVKFDFSLCRIGIVESCRGFVSDKCDECKLLSYCQRL